MPAIYRPAREKGFRCKVGYSFDAKGVRKRREFRLGPDPLEATKKAVAIAEMWQAEEVRHRSTEQAFRDVFGESNATGLPVWTGVPARSAAMREEFLNSPPDDDDPEHEVGAGPTLFSIRQAAGGALDRLLKMAQRDAKAFATHRWYEREFRLGLVKPAINPDLDVRSVTLNHAEGYAAHWCDLTKRSQESKTGKFGHRSAVSSPD
jgi:hypothetical protein